MIFGLILLAIIICVVISCVKVVRQAQALVIERLGGISGNMGEPDFTLRFRFLTVWQEEWI